MVKTVNRFALYHGKQALFFCILQVAWAIVGLGILGWICIGLILYPLGYLFLLVLQIMGIVYSAKGEVKPAPLLGEFGLKLFKSVKVETK